MTPSLLSAIDSTKAIAAVILVVIFLAVILTPIIIVKHKKKKISCPECKTKFTYDDVIRAEEAGTTVMQTAGFAFTNVHVWCKCPECGEISDFTIKFKSAQRNDYAMGSTIKSFDLNQKLRDYFN